MPLLPAENALVNTAALIMDGNTRKKSESDPEAAYNQDTPLIPALVIAMTYGLKFKGLDKYGLNWKMFSHLSAAVPVASSRN